jgi:hypothetical protein
MKTCRILVLDRFTQDDDDDDDDDDGAEYRYRHGILLCLLATGAIVANGRAMPLDGGTLPETTVPKRLRIRSRDAHIAGSMAPCTSEPSMESI